MKVITVLALLMLVFAVSLAAGGSSQQVKTLVAGGTESAVGQWIPGEGAIEPGGKIRRWENQYQDVLVGPAGEFASGSGPATMNCNLDQSMTGPCWGTFSFSNSKGTWEGIWEGQFNFVTGAGYYRAVGHGRGGLRGMTLENHAVYAGWSVSGTTAYVYSKVSNPHGN